MSGIWLEICASCRRHVRADEPICPFCGGRLVAHRPPNRGAWRGIRIGTAIAGVSSFVSGTLGACAVYGAPGPAVGGYGTGGTGAHTGGYGGSFGGTTSYGGTGGYGGTPSCGTGGASDAGADAGPISCPPGTKACDAVCITDNNPWFGCGDPSCQPCAPLGQDSSCVAGACVVPGCAAGTADCDGDPQNGCETDITVDANNCGQCGHACQTSACAYPGQCSSQLLLGPDVDILGVAVDETQLYFTEWAADGAVVAIPKAGGSPLVLAENRDHPRALVVDATHVYWVEGAASGRVMRIEKNGGTPEVFAANQYFPTVIAQDDDRVYWASQEGCGAVMTAPKSGGAASMLAQAPGVPTGIAVFENSVFWLSASAQTVMKVAKSGGAPVTLASGQKFPQGPLVDASGVYWASYEKTSAIFRVPLDGGQPVAIASYLFQPVALAGDEGSVYFATASGGIGAVPKIGGVIRTEQSPGVKITALAVDASHLYWVGHAMVRRAPK